MNIDSSQKIAILFAMEQHAIDHELREAEGRLLEITQEISSLLKMPRDRKSEETEARLAHLMMVQAHEFCRDETVLPEVQTFYAAFGASQIADDAEFAACKKDSLAVLCDRMDEIRQREGLKPDEFWLQSEGPDDYQALDAEFGRLLNGIGETVFSFVLRRYRLDTQADLFEKDRVTFELHREIGRRVVSADRKDAAVADKAMDDFIRGEYGDTALQRLRTRMSEIERLERAG